MNLHSPAGSREQRLPRSDASSFNGPADPDKASGRRSRVDNACLFIRRLPGCYCAGFSAGGGVAGFSVGAGAGVAGFSVGATVVGGGVLVVDCPAGGVVAFFSGAGVTAFFGVGVGAGAFLQPLKVNAAKARTANVVRTTFLMVIPFRKDYPTVNSTDFPACQDP